MTNMELMRANNRSLVARLKDDGTVHEYVVCSNYNGKEWDWGHYFQFLDLAVNYINDPYNHRRDTDVRNVARWIYFAGTDLTEGGGWSADADEIREEFDIDADYDFLCNVARMLEGHKGVAEAWVENNTIEVSFYLHYCGLEEE